MKVLLAVLTMMFFFAAHAQTLTIGTLTTNPPFEMQVSDQKGNESFIGFDIDIMQEICKKIGQNCRFTAINFHEIEKELQRGTIDAAIAAIIITPGRREKFAFTLPYKPSFLQLVTLKNKPFKVKNDLKNHTVGVYTDSPAVPLVLNMLGDSIKIKQYPHSEALFDALVHNEIDALVTSYENAYYWSNHLSQNFKFVGDKFAVGEGYGIMTQKGNQTLIRKMNQALEEIESDGTYLQVYKNTLAN